MMKPHDHTITSKAPQHADKQGKIVRLLCRHRETWPPAESLLPDSPERLRAKQIITETGYQSLKVWERECGKKKMDDDCAECPHARAMARVTARGTGRITNKEIEYAAFMKTSRQDIHLKFERPPPEPTPLRGEFEKAVVVDDAGFGNGVVKSKVEDKTTKIEPDPVTSPEPDPDPAENLAAGETPTSEEPEPEEDDDGDLSAFLDGID